MPKNEPYRAWATFSFTALSGRINECDLFLVAPGGLFLVEFKAHPGRVTNNGDTWQFHGRDRVRTLRNPLHLTNLKSKELKSVLERAARGVQGFQMPRIEPVVFLTNPGLRSELDDFQRPKVYARDAASGLPSFVDDVMLAASQNPARRIDKQTSEQIMRLLKIAGIRPSQRHLRFGDDWTLSADLLDAGPTWEDRLAHQTSGPVPEEGRVRIYLVEQAATDEARESIDRAARREYQVLQGIVHRGIDQAIAIREHMGGPAILFRHRADDLRLDSYLDVHNQRLSPETRLDLVRQLAEAVRYAHNRSLYHRALSARSVYVRCRSDGSAPQLRIIDWQAAARDFDSTTGRSLGNSPVADEHLEDSAQLYLAPEFDSDFPDPIEMDVFGLGAVSFLILTGQPPAPDRTTLIGRVTQEKGLHPFAVAEGLSTAIDELIFNATRGDAAERLESADRFLEDLDAAAAAAEEPGESRVEVDPLTAEPGVAIDGDSGGIWTVERVLGTGSTGKAFLVTRPAEREDGEPSSERRVFKVAINEERAAAQLRKEAQYLEQVGGGAIVRLLAGPRELGGRTLIDLEYAGDQSLRTWLDSHGKLTYHELSQFGGDLFKALDQLAARGLRHRDVKPENLGVFRRADRTRELRLFDFSHASVSDRDSRTGTRGYLDPFIGTPRRPAFDDHAEWYAAAVTLHEMASKERPTWGDGQSDPRATSDIGPRLSADLFEPALRDGLTAFFQRALHREVSERFDTLRMMEEAWRDIFRAADSAAPIGRSSDETLEEQRDSAAEAAMLETNLRASGLSPRAVSVAEGFNATTVGQLLEVAPHTIARARGAGSTVRRELLRRHKQWTNALRSPAEPAKPAPNTAAVLTAHDVETRLRIDTLVQLLTPAGRRGSKTPQVIKLTLGLPVEGVEPFTGWPVGREIAERLGITQGGVAAPQNRFYKQWFEASWLRSVREDLIAILTANGRVMTVADLASAFRIRRGGADGDPEQALISATAVVRAAILAETWSGKGRPEDDEPRLDVSRREGRVFAALESLPGTDDPSPRELADYAIDLGHWADRLVDRDPLPSRSEVVRVLRGCTVPKGMPALSEAQLLALAAGASMNALPSPRFDLFPRNLDLVRALRVSQVAAVGRPGGGIKRTALLERLRAWFPDLAILDSEPSPMDLEEALRLADYPFTYDIESDEFVPPQTSGRQWTSTNLASGTYTPANSPYSPARRPAGKTAANLARAVEEGGFVALTINQKRLVGSAELIAAAHPVVPVDVAAVFLGELRALAQENNQPFGGLLRADQKFYRAGTLPAGLTSYLRAAWQRATETIMARADAPRKILFLHEAGLFARYADAGGHDALTTLQQAARRPADRPYGMWLLCPSEAPRKAPNLDGWTVEAIGTAEWSILDNAYLDSLKPVPPVRKA